MRCEARISNQPGGLCRNCRLRLHSPIPQRTHPLMTRRDSNDSLSSASTTPSTSTTDEPQSQPQLPTVQLPIMPSRRPGDGLDFRRPGGPSRTPSSASNPQHTFTQNLRDVEIVDLTHSDDAEPAPAANSTHTSPFGQARRGPRFDRDIIDLSAESPPEPSSHSQIDPNINRSPEVEFVSARRLPTPPPRPPSVSFTVMDLTEDDSDGNEIEFVGETFVIQDNESGPPSMSGIIQAAFGVVRQAALQGHLHRQPGTLESAHGTSWFATPRFNVTRVNFNFGPDMSESPGPTYRAPPPAPDGFTRSGQEGDILVCPNCERELCSGDTEVKRQVWIIKGCGHVSLRGIYQTVKSYFFELTA